jgi:hypothetical protein
MLMHRARSCLSFMMCPPATSKGPRDALLPDRLRVQSTPQSLRVSAARRREAARLILLIMSDLGFWHRTEATWTIEHMTR